MKGVEILSLLVSGMEYLDTSYFPLVRKSRTHPVCDVRFTNFEVDKDSST